MLHLRLSSALALALSLTTACGGGSKKAPAKPVTDTEVKQAPPPAAETEEDREKKRQAAALQIVPAGANCLPVALKDAGAPRLELAAVGTDAVICAIDIDKKRLLGPVGCWKVDLGSGTLAAQAPAPLPGHSFDVMLDDGCARGFCLPKDAKKPADNTAHISWNLDGTKVAVLTGDDVHVFDASTKEHASTFSIRAGDKGVSNDPTAVYFVGDHVFVEGADQGPSSAVWVFKADGSPVGAIEPIGGKDGKPINLYGGSFSVLDKNRVGVGEQGVSTLTIFEIDSGKRSKLVRAIKKPACKPNELDAYWLATGDAIGDKCKQALDKTYTHLVGAQMVAGSKNFLALLRGPRVGELAVLDAKSLAEKKAIQLQWCPAGGGDAAPAAGGGGAKTKTKSAKDDPDAGNE